MAFPIGREAVAGECGHAVRGAAVPAATTAIPLTPLSITASLGGLLALAALTLRPAPPRLLSPGAYQTPPVLNATAHRPRRTSMAGGSRMLMGGRGPSQRSTSTRACWPLQPWASREVPRSGVSTLGLPCTHMASGSAGSWGSYQAPVESWTTPRRRASLITAPARQLPRSL